MGSGMLTARGENTVFPGWHKVTNLKWRAVRVPDIGAERFVCGFASACAGGVGSWERLAPQHFSPDALPDVGRHQRGAV